MRISCVSAGAGWAGLFSVTINLQIHPRGPAAPRAILLTVVAPTGILPALPAMLPALPAMLPALPAMLPALPAMLPALPAMLPALPAMLPALMAMLRASSCAHGGATYRRGGTRGHSTDPRAAGNALTAPASRRGCARRWWDGRNPYLLEWGGGARKRDENFLRECGGGLGWVVLCYH
eukprot:gene9820-biopygen2209